MKDQKKTSELKNYYFRKDLYLFDVVIPTLLCIALLVVSAYMIFKNKSVSTIWTLVCMLSTYTVFNNIGSFSNPYRVSLSDTSIEFESFKVIHTFQISEVKKLNIREFPSAGLIYLRLDNNLSKGRYWIKTQKFIEGKELFKKLIEIEYKKNPDSLKSYARNTSIKYSKYKAAKGK